ncbi:MAG: response regulator [Lachnospiraceae bacterium]|nr:response regulator [Lachnospiraceae bacterium]
MMFRMEVACLCIVVFVALIYFSMQKEKTITHKLYARIIICAILQLLMDTATLYTVNNLEEFPAWINRLAHQLYVLFLLLLLYYVVAYMRAVIRAGNHPVDIPVIPMRYLRCLQGVILLSVIIMPIEYEQTPYGNYAVGPLAMIGYLGVALCLLMLFHLLFKYGSAIYYKMKWVLLFVLVTVAFVAGFQFLFPMSLISGIGIAVVVLGLYLTVESADAILIEHLKAETRRADAANNAKSTFLANISHEIRTPINAVLGMDEMILRECVDGQIREYASEIKASAKSLLRIINDVLDITKIETGKMEIIPTEYDFGILIGNIVNMIAPTAKKKGLELEVTVDEDIPAKLIGDDIRIRQILLNLLSNAVKYTEKGTIWLNIHLADKGKNVQLLFEVMDTGIGIKEEDIGRLYVAFERIEENRNRHIEGSGLGIVITAQLLRMMDSALNVRSVYGEGTTFFFELSQEIAEDVPVGDFWKNMEENTEEQPYQGDFEAPQAQVLVVDDTPVNRKVFCSLLKETKIQITEAGGGEECLALVKEQHFDLIFMDHWMPGMDGVETFMQMQKLNEYPCKDTPVIVLTANAIRGAKEQYMAQGFWDFMTKPLEPKKLENMLKKWLPKELLQYKEAKVEIAVDSEKPQMPMIGGVDWSYAWLHFTKDSQMREAIQFFCSMAEADAKELDGYYRSVAKDGVLQMYRIKVHSMKNSAGMIGILPLSGMARILEKAADERNIERIYKCHDIFLQEWREYKESMQVCIATADEDKTEVSLEVVEDLLALLKEAAEDMDIDRMDNIILQLKQYQYTDETDRKLQRIAEAVVRFDLEELIRLIGEF